MSSYRFFSVLLAAAVLCGLFIMHFFKLPFWELLDLVPSKVFLVLLFLNRLSGFFSEISRRNRSWLLSAGIIVFLCGLFLNYAYRFEGLMSIGKGEKAFRYEYIEKGPLSRPKEYPLFMGKIVGTSDKDMKAELYYKENAKPLILSQGSYSRISWNTKIGVLRIDTAPAVEVKDKAGRDSFNSFVKLKLHPIGVQDYFSFETIVYRYYVKMTGKEDKPFNLMVMRGKLVLVNKDIAEKEEVEFEGLKFSFPEIVNWAEINVRYDPGEMFMYAGAIIIAFGIIIMFMLPAKRK